MNAIVKPENQQIAPVDQATSILGLIGAASKDPNVNMDKMERLWAMYKEETERQAKVKFNAALGEAQSEIGRVATNKENSQTHSRYADYAAIDRVVRPVYTKHGFSLSFNTGDCALADHMRILCDVAHKDGYTKQYHVDMPADGKGAKGGDVMTKTHAAGSAMQYGQRYLLKLIFNVAIGLDDDGNGANAKAATITEEQAVNMQALLEDIGANKEGFFKYLSTKCKKEIKAYSDIPAMSYESAIKALEQKRKKK
jgi:hypothetical protein